MLTKSVLIVTLGGLALAAPAAPAPAPSAAGTGICFDDFDCLLMVS